MRLAGRIWKTGILLFGAGLCLFLAWKYWAFYNEDNLDPYATLLRQDSSTAAPQFRKLASQGDVEAQFIVATLYFYGRGVPQDYAEAMKWFREAAKQGHSDADFAIGTMYASGQGVDKSPEEAVRWYRRAAELGHARAQLVIASSYLNGQGVSRDDAVAARWFYRAAQQGAIDAQIMLASEYVQGSGVPKDIVSAYAWASIAAARADNKELRDRANQVQDLSARSMRPGDVIEAQRLALGWRPQAEPRAISPTKATLERGGIEGSLFFEADQAVVRWHLTRPLKAQLDLTADIDGKPLGTLTYEPYPPSGAKTSVVLLLDVSDPARQSSIDADKLKIIEVAKKADAQREIDVASYADHFQLLQPKDSSIEALQQVLTQTAPRAEKANLNAALKSAIEMPSLSPAERRGIFVFHDGHTDDALDAKALIDSARMRHTTLNFIISQSPGNRSIDPSRFAALADATGGVVATNGQVVTESGPQPFLDAPFWTLDSGGAIRAAVPRTPRFPWQSDPDVKFAFRIGSSELALNAAMPVPVLDFQETASRLASERPLVAAAVGAAILVLIGGVLFGIGRRSRRPANNAADIRAIPHDTPQQALALLRDEEDGATYPVQSRIVQLGRASEAQIRLKDETVSRVHAILRQLKTGEFEIENCSSNGTFVNNQKVDVATLVDGDLVSLGRTTLRYAQRKLADAGLGPAAVADVS